MFRNIGNNSVVTYRQLITLIIDIFTKLQANRKREVVGNLPVFEVHIVLIQPVTNN